MSEISYRFATEADLPQILTLLSEEYPAYSYSQAFFRWQYFDNPAGAAVLPLAFTNDKLIAVYAAVALPYRSSREVKTIYRFQDAVTLNEFRGKGIMRQLVKMCLDKTTETPLNIAFPNPFSRNALEAVGFSPVSGYDWYVSCAKKGVKKQSWPHPALSIDLPEPAIYDDFHKKYLTQTGRPTLFKDFAYLNWRYARHPKNLYAFLTEGETDMVGFAVLKYYEHPTNGQTKLHLCEFMFLEDDSEIPRKMLQKAGRIAADLGVDEFSFWYPHSDYINGETIARCGFNEIRDDSRRILVKYSHDEKFADNWYWSLGDSDVF